MRSDRLARSIATALLAVMLEAHVRMAARGAPPVGRGSLEPLSPTLRERVAAPLGDAFAHTFWWAAAPAASALAVAVVLALNSAGHFRVPSIREPRV
jgi:hypothetical protein